MLRLFESYDWFWPAICAYIFMRAFEVEFSSSRKRRWYRYMVQTIAGITLAVAGIAFIVLMFGKDGPFNKKTGQGTSTETQLPADEEGAPGDQGADLGTPEQGGTSVAIAAQEDAATPTNSASDRATADHR